MGNKWMVGVVLAMVACVAAATTSYERLASSLARKVVKIGVITAEGAENGSGAFISPSGLILTCNHVAHVGEALKLFVKLDDGTVYAGQGVAHDDDSDLALIVTSMTTPAPYFKLEDKVVRGEQVAIFGSPLGLQRSVGFGWVVNFFEDGSIIHSAPVNPGSSGGPLVNMDGDLIGVNQAILGVNALQYANGMSKSIPVSAVRRLLAKKR